eukprot:Nitzschia sp. Nitz4//scaffold52_size167869//142620//143249//NITZ4_002294-RA/size167869-processed-gene-0.143-mRNA-1//1//CDS//3329554089//738//frame0
MNLGRPMQSEGNIHNGTIDHLGNERLASNLMTSPRRSCISYSSPRLPERMKSFGSSPKISKKGNNHGDKSKRPPKETKSSKSPFDKRKNFAKESSQPVNLSFYMTSSISSLGDASLTFDDISKTEAAELDNLRFPQFLPETPLREHRNRWDGASPVETRLPSPKRRSFEVPPLPLESPTASFNGSFETRRSRSDTRPIIPLRRLESDDE